MLIHWYGHAAFLIQTNGTRIILDPFRSPDSGGYAPIDEPADLVVVSHENDRYHSHLGQIQPPFEVLRAMELPEGGREFAGILFRSIRVFETPERRPEDEVSIVHFEAEGLRVAFLGDLGHALEEEELSSIRYSEILLVPAGGPPTIDFPMIGPLIESIAPRIVIPMHYKTPRINLDIQPVERFFGALPNWPVDRIGGSSIEIRPGSMGSGRRIVWLEPSR